MKSDNRLLRFPEVQAPEHGSEAGSRIDRILKRPQVEALTGLSRTTIYEEIKAERFPQQIKLGPRSVGWLESEVMDWITERVKESRLNQG